MLNFRGGWFRSRGEGGGGGIHRARSQVVEFTLALPGKHWWLKLHNGLHHKSIHWDGHLANNNMFIVQCSPSLNLSSILLNHCMIKAHCMSHYNSRPAPAAPAQALPSGEGPPTYRFMWTIDKRATDNIDKILSWLGPT